MTTAEAIADPIRIALEYSIEQLDDAELKRLKSIMAQSGNRHRQTAAIAEGESLGNLALAELYDAVAFFAEGIRQAKKGNGHPAKPPPLTVVTEAGE